MLGPKENLVQNKKFWYCWNQLIQKISENIAASIIENISGDKLNESSIKATVEDVSKKTIGKYL